MNEVLSFLCTDTVERALFIDREQLQRIRRKVLRYRLARIAKMNRLPKVRNAKWM